MWWFISWFLFGILGAIGLVYVDKKVTVGDIGFLLFLVVIGPVGLALSVGAFFDIHKDKVLWEKS